MKKILEKFSIKAEDTFGAKFVEKGLSCINAHPEMFSIGLLLVACFIFLFLGLDFYPLMDVDETRYAVMSRNLVNSYDWNCLMLNSLPFLEKPPLYFWIVGASIKVFGGFSPFIVRFPIALLSAFLVFFTYFLGKKVISRKFGVISALVLLSSIFFLILSHIAILDMVLTVFMTSALYSAFLSNFMDERFKKYCWWYFYIFVGLGFLAKGILALALPLLIVLLYNWAAKNLKEVVKPINIIPGIAILAVMTIPWHYIMYEAYGFKFIKEYFLLHHFARFINSENIGRERSFLYFIPVFLMGFFPWTFAFIEVLIDGTRKLIAKFKAFEGETKAKWLSLLSAENNEQKLLLFCTISFAVILFVFSTSSTKLPTYILPIFPFAAMLVGYFWYEADEKNIHENAIYRSTVMLAIVLLLAAFSGSVTYLLLPPLLQMKLAAYKDAAILGFYLLTIYLSLRLNTKRALSVFSGYILVMIFVIMLAVSHIFNFVYQTGENEIVRYSSLSMRDDDSSQLVTFDFAVKPSAMIKYTSHVNFITDPDFEELDRVLKYIGGPTFVIVKNKNFENDKEYLNKLNKRMELIQQGEKYSLFVQDVNNEYEPVGRYPMHRHHKGKKHHNGHKPIGEPQMDEVEPPMPEEFMEGPNPEMMDEHPPIPPTPEINPKQIK